MIETLPKHPARYSKAIKPVLRKHCEGFKHVLDPFAGVGGIFEIGLPEETIITAVEIEENWAAYDERILHMDIFKAIPLMLGLRVDCICTSPTYGNRMADHHKARDNSHRRTYRHYYGEDLSSNNSGLMQWGPDYKVFHERAWAGLTKMIDTTGKGRFILNIKDHIRAGEWQNVPDWHRETLQDLGWNLVETELVETSGYRYGENHEARKGYEEILVFDRG